MATDGFGQRVADARRALALRLGRDVTKKAIAEALGVTGTAVGSWEAGEKEPNFETVARLADVLGVSAAWLAFGVEVAGDEPRADELPRQSGRKSGGTGR